MVYEDLSYPGQDMDLAGNTSSRYGVQMLDSSDASRASSFASHAYYSRPEPQSDTFSTSKVFATTGYSPSSVSRSSQQFRNGVEYLEPRYVEGRAVESLAPYQAHRVVDLQGGHVQRRQVTEYLRCWSNTFLSFKTEC